MDRLLLVTTLFRFLLLTRWVKIRFGLLAIVVFYLYLCIFSGNFCINNLFSLSGFCQCLLQNFLVVLPLLHCSQYVFFNFNLQTFRKKRIQNCCLVNITVNKDGASFCFEVVIDFIDCCATWLVWRQPLCHYLLKYSCLITVFLKSIIICLGYWINEVIIAFSLTIDLIIELSRS